MSAVLLWGVVAFAAKPMSTPPAEALPVDFIYRPRSSRSSPPASRMRRSWKRRSRGRQGRRAEADRTGRAESRGQARDRRPTPRPTKPPTPEAEAEAAGEAEKKKQPEPKLDQIAEELKKEDAKNRRRPRNSRRRRSRRAEVRCQPGRGAARQARPAAASSRPPKRSTTRRRLAPPPAAPPSCRRARSMRLRARLEQCWNPPAAAASPIRTSSTSCCACSSERDGSLARDPRSSSGNGLDIRAGPRRERHARAARVPALHDAASRNITTNGKTSRSTSILATCSADDRRCF